MINNFDRNEMTADESFFKENERKINQIVCRGMAYAFVAFPVMLIINSIGIFKFSGTLVLTLLLLGSFCTLSPIIVSRFVKNQVFIKYYALICIIVLISYLATRYHVGIYITLILASIVSCLYFDKKFTVQIVALSYIGFLISYYFRTIEIRNHLYPTETVLENYIPLAAGFTIEFFVSLLFLYKLADRTHSSLLEQKRMIDEISKSEAKMHLALDATKDILFEYNIEKDSFSSNGTIRGWGRKDILIENFRNYVEKMDWKTEDFLNALQKYVTMPEEEGNRFQEEICISFTENGKEYPTWAYFELNILRNSEGRPSIVIGKLRDITKQKMDDIKIEEAKKFDTLSGMYNYASLRKIIKELEGQSEAVMHQIMTLHIKNYQEITQCYGEVYRDFIMVNTAEVIKNAVSEEVLTCRLSDTVFLIYIEDNDKVDGQKIRKEISRGLHELYIGEQEVNKLIYDFGYYIGDEQIDELLAVALRYVHVEELPGDESVGAVTENSWADVIAGEENFCQIADVERQEKAEVFIHNMEILIGGARDFQSAVHMAMGQIGKFFGLSGIRVYEFPETTQSLLPEFIWTENEQIAEECSGMVLSYEVRNFFVENFERSRVVDNTIGAFQDFFRQFGENPLLLNKYSSLICPILAEKECRAVILYDVPEVGYAWSDQQKELLLETSKVLGNNILAFFADSVSKKKNVFLSNLSYEIRSPINAIMGMTEIARGQLGNVEQIESCLDSIDTSSKQLVSIVNDVFDLSKMELGKMKLSKDIFSLEDMIAQIENQMLLEAKRKDIEFILERKFQENLLYGDAPRIFQVVSYLIENALRYTKRGGSVRALVEEIKNSGENVTLFFEIQDNGESIRQDSKEKMFVAFEQDDSRQSEKHGDTGLDLAVCYHLVQMMGANLEVKSEPNQGTIFYFTLKVEIPPKDRIMQFHSRKMEESNDAVDLSGKKIILAEDNAVSAEIVKRLLERQGAIVTVAENGEVCVSKYSESQINEIDFILMDINMPKMNGHEAAKLIRASGRTDAKSVSIIAMTANAFEEDMQESLAAGMDAHLAKPVQLKALLEKLGDILIAKGRGE